MGNMTRLENLRGLREDRDLRQQDVADYLNVHQVTYSNYESGRLDVPTGTLKKLAVYFDTSADYILGLTDEMGCYPRKK